MLHSILRSTLLPLLLLACAVSASAQAWKAPEFPVPFGPNNVGTEFYFSFPANFYDPTADVAFTRLYISSAVSTTVSVYVGETLKTRFTTQPHSIDVVPLTIAEAQIFIKELEAPVPPDQIYQKKAIRVIADDPIIVYGMNRVSFTSDGFLALPTNGLGYTYIVASARSVFSSETRGIELPSQYMIIAPYDSTTVSIINSMRTPNHAEGSAVGIVLNKGDVYSAMSEGLDGDLSGTIISANKPIAVMGGQNCTYLPDGRYPACDHIVEMLPPVGAWGRHYHSVPFAKRQKGDYYRIFSSQPNTKVFINGELQATISGVGGQEGDGWIAYLPEERELLDITSDKPIFVAQYNNSQRYEGATGTATDPFYTILTPVEQYQTGLTFVTPSQDFAENYVNLVSDSAGFHEIEIARGNSGTWRKLKDVYGDDFTLFQELVNGRRFVGKTIKIDPDVYRMRGPLPFAGYIYGFGEFDSYGYPLSVAVGNLSVKDEDAPDVEYTVDCRGTITGTVTDRPDDVAVRSNLSTITPIERVNYTRVSTPDRLRPGLTITTPFELRVIDPRQEARVILDFSDQAGNHTYDTIEYKPFDVTLAPDHDLGDIVIGNTDDRQLTLTNRSTQPATVREVLVQRGDAGFDIVDPAGSVTIPPGGTRDVTVRFTASATGRFSDSVGIFNGCDTIWFAVVRANVVQPVISVSDYTFPATVVGTPVTHDIEITNSGTGTLTVTGHAGGPYLAVFTLPNGLPAFPLELDAGETQTLTVQFQPAAVQSYRDSIVFAHNAPASDQNDPVGILIGRGIRPGLSATNHDFLRRRVVTGPHNATISITNSGTSPGRILGVKGTPAGDVADFTLDASVVADVTIPAGGSISVPVTFSPTATGPRQMTVYFNTEDPNDSTVFTVLDGFGIVPGLATQDLDFGTMDVGGTPVQMTVDFELSGDPATRDQVTITDFVIAGANPGDFTYQVQGRGVPTAADPIILRPQAGQDRVTVIGTFNAQASGPRSATLTAVTTDLAFTTPVSAVSNWNGVGKESGISITSTTVDPCVGEEDTIEVTISLNSPEDVEITGLSIENDQSGSFRIIDGSTPVIVQPGSDHKVRVVFAPTSNGSKTATLVVTSDATSSPRTLHGLTGLGVQTIVDGIINLSGTAGDGDSAVFGDLIRATVVLTNNMSVLNTTSYTLTLTYDPLDLVAPSDASAIMLNPAVHPAGSVATINPASTPGTLIVDVTSPTPFFGVADLISVDFRVLLNRNLSRTMGARFEYANARCATVSIRDRVIDVAPICGLNWRLIEMTNIKYALGSVAPDPTIRSATLTYSIGLDGPTQLLLHDAAGAYVGTLIDEYQQPGTYQLSLDVTQLPSGLYYYTLISGDYSETRAMRVTK